MGCPSESCSSAPRVQRSAWKGHSLRLRTSGCLGPGRFPSQNMRGNHSGLGDVSPLSAVIRQILNSTGTLIFTAKAKTIGADGHVTDGAFAAATGYTLIKSDSLDHAVEVAKGCPVLLGGAKVAVYETFDAMAAMAGSKP